MNLNAFHIPFYQLIQLATLFSGLTLALLLAIAKKADQRANLFLSSALVAIILKAGGLIPFFLPALGPLLYFYVRQLTRTDRQFRGKDALHFSILLAGYWMPEWSILISVIIYLYLAHKLIADFYRRLRPILMDRPRFAFRQLDRLLLLLGLFCALSWFNDIFYLAVALVLIVMAVEVILKPDNDVQLAMPITERWDAREKSRRLKEAVATKRLYKDAEMTLATLAVKLMMHPHDLSRIINLGLGKNFSDFINEFRVREVVRKMQDPVYDRLTLLGIAHESGFNSERTFHRVFKEMTGKTPLEYKNGLKKELPIDKLAARARIQPVILRSESPPIWAAETLKRNVMIKNYLKIAWRNVTRNKASSVINIGGLAVGMAVAMLIGLWILDELSYDKYHRNYDRIAMAMQSQTVNGSVNTGGVVSLPLEGALRKNYGSDFKHIVVTGWNDKHVLSVDNKNITFTGNFMSPEAPEMFTFHMLAGDRNGLRDRSSILLSGSTARALFGDTDPVNKVIRLDGKDVFKVAGVYEDLPENTTLHDLAFVGAFDYYVHSPGNERSLTDWGNNSLFVYVQIADNADMAVVSAKIRDIKLNNMSAEDKKYKPIIFLQPMSKWHLYAEFHNGINTGGAIQYVWLFGTIGIFVLLLACINFMNLSTARSEKRAKEVGIRKAIGSLKIQLVKQFYWESFLIALLSFAASLALVWLALSWFNNVSGKQINIPWGNPLFWVGGLGFTFFTGMIAGSYPALYLSSFNPIKVLKGTFKAGPFAAVPRKILVVTQFTVSIILIIGTIVVFKQVEYAKDRPIGYDRAGLVDIQVTNDDLHKHFAAVKADLLSSGAVSAVAEASSSTTGVNNDRGDINWSGKDPSKADYFGSIRVTTEYGKTVGWQFTEGRDFAAGNVADSLTVVLNEAAVKYMGLKHPIGQIVRVGKRDMTVIGVIKNMVMESPYEPVKQTIFYLGRGPFDDVLIRVNPNTSAHDALDKIAKVSKTYSPSVPFSYRFADDEYARKFVMEERIGKLASAFAVLAIFISCLGLFGMASFAAEQRVKEIGVRKVLGASVFGLWRLMSKDFVVLIAIALLIAMPVAYSFMHNWLQHYTFHTDLSWWVFAATAAGAMLITLLTVSYQSIKAALANPVKSLRSE